MVYQHWYKNLVLWKMKTFAAITNSWWLSLKFHLVAECTPNPLPRYCTETEPIAAASILMMGLATYHKSNKLHKQSKVLNTSYHLPPHNPPCNLCSLRQCQTDMRKVKTPNWSEWPVGQKEFRSQIPSPRSSIPNPRSRIPNFSCPKKNWVEIFFSKKKNLDQIFFFRKINSTQFFSSDMRNLWFGICDLGLRIWDLGFGT